MTKSILLGALFLSTAANAGIYTGNPNLDFKVDRPEADFKSAVVDVDVIRIHACDGKTTDYNVGQTVDLVVGLTVTINGGDLCFAEMIFDSEMYITGEKFVIATAETSTLVDLDPLEAGALPYQTVAGDLPAPSSLPLLIPSL